MSAARAARKLKQSKSTGAPSKPQATPATIQQHKLGLLTALSASFDHERSRFRPPTQLAFVSTASLENLKLDYSPENSSLHAYEDFLVKLLIDYDRVESDGDDVVRNERRRNVKEVEAELERLVALKRTAFLDSLAPSSTKRRDPSPAQEDSLKVSTAASAKQRKRRNQKKSLPTPDLPLSVDDIDSETTTELESKPLPSLPTPSPPTTDTGSSNLSRPPGIPFDPTRPIFRPSV